MLHNTKDSLNVFARLVQAGGTDHELSGRMSFFPISLVWFVFVSRQYGYGTRACTRSVKLMPRNTRHIKAHPAVLAVCRTERP